MTDVAAEGEWLAGLQADAKAKFLAQLAHTITITITIAGRRSPVAGRRSHGSWANRMRKLRGIFRGHGFRQRSASARLHRAMVDDNSLGGSARIVELIIRRIVSSG